MTSCRQPLQKKNEAGAFRVTQSFYFCENFQGNLEPVSFLKYFEGHDHLEAIIEKLAAPPGEKIHLQGLIGSYRAIMTANLHRRSIQNKVFLLEDREEAAYFYDDLNNLGL